MCSHLRSPYAKLKRKELTSLERFIDLNGYEVALSFTIGNYEVEPKHVLVIVKQGNQLLCTIHKKRGVEFPGGKAEAKETLVQAAIREVLEETNVVISNVQEIGHYIVYDEQPFCKVIFTAEVLQQYEETFLYETKGRKWLTIEQLKQEPNLSFYMKDDGMKRILEVISHDGKRHNL